MLVEAVARKLRGVACGGSDVTAVVFWAEYSTASDADFLSVVVVSWCWRCYIRGSIDCGKRDSACVHLLAPSALVGFSPPLHPFSAEVTNSGGGIGCIRCAVDVLLLVYCICGGRVR